MQRFSTSARWLIISGMGSVDRLVRAGIDAQQMLAITRTPRQIGEERQNTFTSEFRRPPAAG
jgi:hypothetical protein